MAKQGDINRVCKLMSRWLAEIRQNNAISFYDINNVAEDIALDLLNEIYDLHLVNLNYEKSNYPGIDLGDKTNKIAFQITSRKDAKKIEENLRKFVRGPKDIYSNGIRFLILNQEKPQLRSKKYSEIYPRFDTKKHILTDKDLIREVKKIYEPDRDRFNRIKAILEEEFGEDEKGKKASLRRLFNGSKKYYEALTGVNGRFKHLMISDIILSRSENEWIETIVSMGDKREKTINVLSALPELWKNECKHAVIVGAGGMGKTVSLIRLWEEYTKEYEPEEPVPIFIQLNEYNQISDESQREGFIVSMIQKNYLDDSKFIREAMKNPLKEGDGFVPSMILLLDGFNEITIDKRRLLIELRDIIEQCHGVQIVFTSRYDMRTIFNWSEFNLLQLLELDDSQVKDYLHRFRLPVPDKKMLKRLHRLVKNPMMLTLYASTCEVEKIHRDDANYAFKKRVETPGELLWNFIEGQVARLFERVDKKEGERWFYKFLLKFILPAIGYEMEKVGRFEFDRNELDNVLEKYCKRFYEKDFFATFPEYRRHVKDLNLMECDKLEEEIERIENLIKTISEELVTMVKEENSFRFLHQDFRDFFASVYILNELFFALEKKEIADVLKERTLPIFLRSYIGEIKGEHYSKPVLKEGKGWEIKENKDSFLYKVLDLCRGQFDRSIGFAVWNIVEIWKDVRGELSGADLSHLDLSGVTLNTVRCNRFYKDTYISAIFDHSLLHEKSIFPQGHFLYVNSVVYSPDGKKILSASYDATIKEWNIETGECLQIFFGHSDRVNKAVYSPDGKRILSASWDFTIKEWDVKTGECLKTFKGHSGQVKSAVYSPDSKKVISSSSDETIKEWDIETNECLKTFQGHSKPVESAVYSPDSKKILSASSDATIKEWDIETGECLKTFQGHSGQVKSAVYSPDGKKILSASYDTTIKEWDIKTGECLKTFQGHFNWVNSAVYSPDGKRILSASYDAAIKEWDIEIGECLKTFQGHSQSVENAVYSPGGKKILSASSDLTIKEWNIETGECLTTYQGHSSWVNSVVNSPDGKKILSASSDAAIKEWDVETGECLKTFQGHSQSVESAVYSPDVKKILSVSWDETIKEWDIETGECLKTYRGHPEEVTSAVYSPDSKKILLASGGRIKERDVETGEWLKTYEGYSEWITSAVYSPCGKKILSVSDAQTIKEWDVETGECLKTFSGHSEKVRSAVYSPDGKKIFSVSDTQTIKEWDIETGKCLKTYQGHFYQLDSVVHSLEGKKILSSSGNKIELSYIESGGSIIKIQNIPGLFVQKCSFRHLHRNSRMSEEIKELLKRYGAVFE